MKICFVCGVKKSLDEFHKHKQMADGHINKCKLCTIEYVKGHYQKNKDAIRPKNNLLGKKYYEANREKLSAKHKQYYLDNPDKWQIKLERNRAHAKANRTAKTADTLRYRARKKAAPGFATNAQIAARIAYYGFMCWICRGPWREIDHVKPLTKGGTGWPANLRPICRRCNASKGNQWPFVIPTQQTT